MKNLYALIFLLLCVLSCDKNPGSMDEPEDDINNTAPQITDQSFRTAENNPNTYLVGKVLASDPDADQLSYSIVSGNTGDAFTISSSDGELSVAKKEALDFELSPTFTLRIQVSDGKLSSEADITIDLIDEFESNELPATGPCQTKRMSTNWVALGMPKVEGLTPSLGKVNMVVLFTDFSDVPATKSPEEVYSILNPIAPDFINEISYGRMELNLQPYHKWLRLSEPAAFYGASLRDGAKHRAFLQEAVDAADAQVDFSETDIVLVVSNPDATEIPYGPTYGSLSEFWDIKADGANISNGINSGYDLNNWGGIWLAHELGHALSLPDLYDFGNGDIHRHVGTFGLMGLISGEAPGYFAFERWMLGWLDDSQIYCHNQGEIVIGIEQIESPGGIKAAMVPLDTTTAIVIESRRKIGFDRNLTNEGILVYVIDTKIESGRGPIKVKPGAINGSLLADAPMRQGDKYEYQNVTIEVIESKSDGDRVHITIN